MTVNFESEAEAREFKMAAFNSIRAMGRMDWTEFSGKEAQQWFEDQAKKRTMRNDLLEPFALFCMKQFIGNA
jgi:hypothetical protein